MRGSRNPARWAPASLGLIILAVSSGSFFPARAQQQHATLAGTWKYDPQRSAEERKAETGTVTAGPGMIRDRSQPRTSGDVRPTGAERVQPGEQRGGAGGAMAGPMSPFLRPQPQLVIVQSDSTVTVTLPNGVTELYRLDGRKERVEGPGAEPIETSARWKGGKLTIERKFGSTGTIREVYSVAAEGKELLIEVRMTSAEAPQPIDQKRVYDLLPPRN